MLKSRKKHINQNKVIDMPIYFHVRANYITKLWRSSLQNKILVPSFTVYGWDPEGPTQRVHNHFPDNMADIFFDLLFDEDGCESGIENDESHDD